MPPIHLITLSVTLTLWLSSCTVGPNYQQPANNLPANYKATGEASIPPVGDPYHLFRDPDLNRLLAASEKNNQDLVAALARIDQSRALLGLTKADRAPSLTADLGATRNLDSRETNMPIEGGAYGEFSSQLNLSYEIDLWGRIRRSVNQANANLKASEADYHAALLSLKGEVARNYLTLRSLDREIDLLEQTRDLRAKRRDLTRARKTGGTASGLDLSRAETELQSSRAEIARLRLRRGELENTLAALTGSPASTFNLTSRTTNPRLPNIPAGVPSDLLRRRPDLIASERRLAAASEGIKILPSLPRFADRLFPDYFNNSAVSPNVDIFPKC
ncbi:MAG: efflux transporter outer membrane subunit [Verrucomicrobiota bacterium]